MKLYIGACTTCRQKIVLDISARNRSQVRSMFGNSHLSVRCGHCHHTNIYNVTQILAESDANAKAGGAVAGGLFGLLGGPIGLIVGAIAGGLIGNANDEGDVRSVNEFNNSF